MIVDPLRRRSRLKLYGTHDVHALIGNSITRSDAFYDFSTGKNEASPRR